MRGCHVESESFELKVLVESLITNWQNRTEVCKKDKDGDKARDVIMTHQICKLSEVFVKPAY